MGIVWGNLFENIDYFFCYLWCCVVEVTLVTASKVSFVHFKVNRVCFDFHLDFNILSAFTPFHVYCSLVF